MVLHSTVRSVFHGSPASRDAGMYL